ncbi:MAG: hypothetical protein J6I85_07080 [Clostridia bacterium]|nr:hypothetical protein [Clostridia bacterium]MBP3801763.1 hypothetical protein [Clostridia bacterium]
MLLEPKFEVPVFECKNIGEQGIIEEVERATEIFSNGGKNFTLGFANPNINSNTIAYLMDCMEFPEKFNNYPDVLRLAYTIYQISDYKEINRFLKGNRGKIDGKDKTFISTSKDGKEKIRCSTQNIISALDLLIETQSVTKQDIILHRATFLKEIFTDIDIDKIEDISQLIGRTYVNHSYTSTSPKPITFGKFKDRDTFISIKVPKGTHVLGPFANVGECEILLGREYPFKILGFEQINGNYHVYVELQPREKELELKSLDEIKEPELVEGDKGIEIPLLHSFSEPQQDMIEFEENRKEDFLIKNNKKQIVDILNIALQDIKQEVNNKKNIYYNLVLKDNIINIDLITQELSQIINAIQNNNFDLNELTNILQKINEDKQNFFNSVKNIKDENETRYIEALGKRIETIISQTEIKEIEEKINQLKSEKISVMERIFGKDKFNKALIENLKKQKEKILNSSEVQYSSKGEVFNRIITYVQENGVPDGLYNLIETYCDNSMEIATDEEKSILMDLVSSVSPRKKELLEENISLFSIRKRTKAIQEETQNMQIDNKTQKTDFKYEESVTVKKIMNYLKNELEPYIEERKKDTLVYEKTSDEKVL